MVWTTLMVLRPSIWLAPAWAMEVLKASKTPTSRPKSTSSFRTPKASNGSVPSYRTQVSDSVMYRLRDILRVCSNRTLSCYRNSKNRWPWLSNPLNKIWASSQSKRWLRIRLTLNSYRRSNSSFFNNNSPWMRLPRFINNNRSKNSIKSSLRMDRSSM